MSTHSDTEASSAPVSPPTPEPARPEMGHAAAEGAPDDAAEASTYAARLQEALESPTKGAAALSLAVRCGGDTEASDDDDEDEDEDEGAFVYMGKDAPPPLPYEERLREVVGAQEALARPHEGRGDAEEHHLDERRDTVGAVQSLVGQGEATPVSPATSRITSAGSNDEFPTLNFRQGPQRARSSLGTAPTQRPPFHPSFSRLRSISTQSFPHIAGPGSSGKNRFVSSSTYNTAMEFPASATTSPRRPPFATGVGGTPSTSALDLDGFSRRSSVANLRDLPSASDLPFREGVPTSNASSAGVGGGAGGGSSLAATAPPARTIKWSSLKRLSARLYPSSAAGNGGAAEQMARGAMGSPTVMAVSGLVAVGTSKGWVLVFDFGQNLRCVCGTEAIAKEAGAVTAVAVSQDHTFVAVGHETGHIHLYALVKPSQPARSVPPVALQQVLAGRKEGHLDGSSICHLGFVGARHTAIVSSDDKGLAFYHSLGKVLMLASTDIIRMLGRYPDPATALASPPPSTPSSRPPLATALTTPPPLASVASPPSSPAFPTSPRSNPLSTGFPHPPHPASRAATPSGSKKPSVVLDMAPLPLGPAPHPQTDPLSLVALLTPTKLVVVGLKPAPRTWWRVQFAREAALGGTGAGAPEEDVERGWASQGVVAWWPSARKASDDAAAGGAAQDGKKDAAAGEEAQGEDPILAWSWGRRVRLVRVRGVKGGLAPLPKRNPVGALKPLPPPPASVDFEEIEGWNCDTAVLALRWYNERVIVVLTASHFDVYDVSTRQCIGRDAHDIRSIVSSDVFTSALPPALSHYDSLAYSGSFAVFKRKLFLLGTSDLRAGAVLTWADRILALMQPATILDAIETTTAYLQGKVDASTIPLPEDPEERRDVLEPKLREILNASLDFVFSEERLRDGSHSDGETIQRLFEGLVGTCVRACLVLGDADWLFDELYERYEQNGIEGIFLDRIEPFVLGGAMHTLPPSVSQRLIAIHAERRQFDAVQRIVWRVDPQNLDLNQVLGLCQRERLYDALIHVQTRALHDYVAPLVELFGLIRRIQQHRKRRPKRIGEGNGVDGVHDDGSDVEDALEADGGLWRSVTQLDQDVEATVPDAYKVFAYLSQELVGQSYPTGTALEYGEAVKARDELYGFLLSGATRTWPAKGGRSVLTSDEDGAAEPTYPYIRLLLRFDTEATLDTLDLAFEDSYLDGEDYEVASSRRVSRQRVIDLLLEIMSPSSSFGSPDDADDFSPVDRTFLYIFVARNLPKYTQYLSLPVATLRDILVSLASDPDQSTVDDRQLAAEYLLSTYTPTDSDTLIPLFERAGFFRILRSIYRGERRWAALAATYLRDPDVASDVFGFLRETLKLAAKASATQKADLASTILDAVPTLVQVDETGLQQTADLVDTFLPSHHAEVVDRLATSHWRAFAYLRCLLEPSYAGMADTTAVASADRLPSKHVDDALRRRYLSLLCAHEPQHVVRYLESEPNRVSQDAEVLRICEEAESFDALVWALDKNGEPEAALQRADETLEARTEFLVERLVASGGEVEEDGAGSDEGVSHGRSVEALLEQVTAVSAAATAVCVRRTTGRRRPKDPPPEDLWFRLLSSLVATVRSVRSVAPGPDKPRDKSASQRRISTASIIVHDEEDAAEPLTPHAAELLSSLIPDALSSLVSTTSSHDVSFPRLVRRLIDSNSSTPAANRSYAEFKAIVSSMLDTYSFEGDLLGLSSTITSQDLFEHVQEYQRERDRGWRPGATNPSGTCAECLEPVWGPQGAGTSPAMSRSASVSLVLESMGPGDGARPRMKKRPSIKGKEVDWPDPPTHSPSGRGSPSLPQLDPPRGVVVGRDGRLWHQTCHLTRNMEEGM